jgi:hypothetical protein
VPSQESASLNSLLATQLGTCIVALKAGKQEQVIRMSFLVSVLFTRNSFNLFLFLFAAQSGGHEVWNAVFELVKNVSEVMMSALPNFWKIAKGFLEGKYKKVTPLLLRMRGLLSPQPRRHRTSPRPVHGEVHHKFGPWLSTLSNFTYCSSLSFSSSRTWR